MRRTILLIALAAATAMASVLVLGADVIAAGEAAGHVRYHAIVAIVVAGLGSALAWRGARTDQLSAPAIGLLALAIAQLVEGVGGAGFDARNETRNGLAVVDDQGLVLMPRARPGSGCRPSLPAPPPAPSSSVASSP
jgi:hypothetical protein